MKDPFAPWVSTKHPGVRKGTHHETGAVKWKVFYRPVGAVNQTSRTFDTLDAARRFRTEHEQELERARDGRGRLTPKRTMPLRSYVAERFLPRYSGRTRAMYANAFRAIELVDSEFMALPIGLITAGDIEIMLSRFAERYAASTTNTGKRAVLVALNRAADDGYIERLHVRISNRRQPKPQQPPTPTELSLLLEELPARHRVPVLVAAATGVRSGELRGLAPEDIDGLEHDLRHGWHRGAGPYRVHVRRQIDQHARELMAPKSEAGERSVVVYPEVVDAIATHLNTYGVGRVAGQTLLWPVSGETIRRPLTDAAKRVMGRSLKLHSLRRYYATQLAYGGVPVHEIQRDLGHSDPSVTLSWYTEAMQRHEPLLPADAAAVLRLGAAKGR